MASKWYLGVLFAVTISLCAANKYSAGPNDQFRYKLKSGKFKKTDRPFRMNKVNLVWEKAMKRLNELQLLALYDDLLVQDKLEAELKKKISASQDEDGEFQAVVRLKMLELLNRHSLDDHYEARRTDENETVDKSGGSTGVQFDPMKLDKKLAKIWLKAQQSGFTKIEMEQLKREIIHHQLKMMEFNRLKDQLEVTGDEIDNSIDQFKDTQHQFGKKITHGDLKIKHASLLESFKILEEMSMGGKQGKTEFTEPKVIELWLLAKKANFTEVELESFKEELQHFETKIKKHTYFIEQAEMVPLSDKTNELPESKFDIHDKAQDYGYKVKKLHTELRTRLEKQITKHAEL